MTLTPSSAAWNIVAASIIIPLHPLLSLYISYILLNYNFKNIRGLPLTLSPYQVAKGLGRY
jgi:hypothetical protein